MNFRESIKNFIELASPKSLRNWIEELLQHNENQAEKIERLEAQIKKLQGLPAKPKFKVKDKTSELDNNDSDDDDDSTTKKREKAVQ
jgi:hypothetical protein